MSTESAGVGETHELLTLNIGPHHPATHGVLRLIATLEGEVVRDIKPIIGYVHTGIEKTAEAQVLLEGDPRRSSGWTTSSYYFNAMAFCGAVETLLGIEVPPRAQYLRVIHLELNRIMSHLVWLGTSALDLGAMSMFWYCFRERETILDLFEMSSGQRMHTRYFQVGGVFEDIPPGFAEEAVRRSSTRCRRAPTSTRTCSRRTRSCSRACATPASSTSRRCSSPRRHGTAAARRRQPVGPAQGGAVLELRPLRLQDPGRHGRRQLRPLPGPPRRAVRVDEDHPAGARTACPRARTYADDRKVALPPRHELATSMEALIHHFKLVTEGFRVPPGEAITRSSRRAASSAASSAPTAPPSPRACTCATPASSTCRRPRRWSRTPTSPT